MQVLGIGTNTDTGVGTTPIRRVNTPVSHSNQSAQRTKKLMCQIFGIEPGAFFFYRRVLCRVPLPFLKTHVEIPSPAGIFRATQLRTQPIIPCCGGLALSPRLISLQVLYRRIF